MTDRDEIIVDRANHNLNEFMEYGPGLRWTTQTWVVAKDTKKHRVKLGGLGAMGVGQMWVDTDGDHYTHADDPTYADAPEVDAPDGPFD